MLIYCIVCSETLKIYIGQHKGTTLRKYLHTKFSDAKHRRGGRSRLFNAMRLHPKETWSIHPLVSNIESKKELDETEQLLIYALNSQHPDVGYNICDGGEGFSGSHSAASRQKMSVNHKYDAQACRAGGLIGGPHCGGLMKDQKKGICSPAYDHRKSGLASGLARFIKTIAWG